MNTKLRQGLTLLLLLVLAVSLGMAGRKQLQYHENGKSRAAVLQLAQFQEPADDDPASDLVHTLAALQAVNSDVIGWAFHPRHGAALPAAPRPGMTVGLFFWTATVRRIFTPSSMATGCATTPCWGP